jgi:hypothetical protein
VELKAEKPEKTPREKSIAEELFPLDHSCLFCALAAAARHPALIYYAAVGFILYLLAIILAKESIRVAKRVARDNFDAGEADCCVAVRFPRPYRDPDYPRYVRARGIRVEDTGRFEENGNLTVEWRLARFCQQRRLPFFVWRRLCVCSFVCSLARATHRTISCVAAPALILLEGVADVISWYARRFWNNCYSICQNIRRALPCLYRETRRQVFSAAPNLENTVFGRTCAVLVAPFASLTGVACGSLFYLCLAGIWWRSWVTLIIGMTGVGVYQYRRLKQVKNYLGCANYDPVETQENCSTDGYEARRVFAFEGLRLSLPDFLFFWLDGSVCEALREPARYRRWLHASLADGLMSSRNGPEQIITCHFREITRVIAWRRASGVSAVFVSRFDADGQRDTAVELDQSAGVTSVKRARHCNNGQEETTIIITVAPAAGTESKKTATIEGGCFAKGCDESLSAAIEKSRPFLEKGYKISQAGGGCEIIRIVQNVGAYFAVACQHPVIFDWDQNTGVGATRHVRSYHREGDGNAAIISMAFSEASGVKGKKDATAENGRVTEGHDENLCVAVKDYRPFFEKIKMTGFKVLTAEDKTVFVAKLGIFKGAFVADPQRFKMRTNKAFVLALAQISLAAPQPHYVFGATKARSFYEPSFVYRLGSLVEVDDCDANPSIQCGRGIHFFPTQQQAISYIGSFGLPELPALPDNMKELEENFAGLETGPGWAELSETIANAAAEAPGHSAPAVQAVPTILPGAVTESSAPAVQVAATAPPGATAKPSSAAEADLCVSSSTTASLTTLPLASLSMSTAVTNPAVAAKSDPFGWADFDSSRAKEPKCLGKNKSGHRAQPKKSAE